MENIVKINQKLSVIHEVKTWSEHYIASKNEVKKATIRKNDRNYHVGDLILSKEYNPLTNSYSGNQTLFLITHKIEDCIGLEKDYVILSLRKIEHYEIV